LEAVTNVDELMTVLVGEPTHADALRIARQLTPAELADLCDLCYVEVAATARKDTKAVRVVVEGRGVDPEEIPQMCRAVGVPVPRGLRALPV
jgi:hypothetical protein